MESLYKDNKKLEEVQDIIDRMPERFGRWVAIAVVGFTVLLLVAGFTIKYPDVVTGQIAINSSQAPVKLVADMSGKLQLLHTRAREYVAQNEYVAVIQNAAHTDDMKRVIALVRNFNPNAEQYEPFREYFPEKVSLGELNLKYFTFLSALKTMCHYEAQNSFQQKQRYLMEYSKWQKVLLQQNREEIKVSKEKLTIAEKWLERNAGLFRKDMIPESEMDQIRSQYLSVKSNYQSLQKTETSIQIQLSEVVNQLRLLEVDQREKENELHLNLLSSFQELTDNLKVWEERYVFKAPFDGRVEFLEFWQDGQFVQAGEEVFSIIPQHTDIVGQVFLPAVGAGKVKMGDDVIIKLNNYPYAEFGSVSGKVVAISLVTNEVRTAQDIINTYLVTVALPEKLETNYGEKLKFQHDLKGTADIVVKKRRLMQRLFDNLKYTTK